MWNQFGSSIWIIQSSQKPAEPNGLIPLRPILSVIGTCSYNLEKLFVPIIKEFTVNEYKVKDPSHFQMNLVTKRLTWFDIKSLFTNIPLDETIKICLELLFYKKRKVKGIMKKQVKELPTYPVKSSTFTLNDVCYKQIDGVAMVSSLGTTLANMFLVYYEQQ